ncbi:hypothetical protein ABZ467_38670 [Streptomyces sp. NPDC005727]|uniref:hypothetical protein n=1 Tax=Streptomyces sp. NPDC005727 TaxID=3157053 RepID=UPI0033D56403
MGRWWVPILDGGERVGVLGIDVTEGVGVEQVGALASLVGLLVVSKRPHTHMPVWCVARR